MRVAVLGAGITGITTAYALLERDADVTLIDRHRYAAMETSYANGGQLSASNAEVWNHWSTVAKGIAWLLKRDAPLALNPRPSWQKYAWLVEFLTHIRHYRRNTIATAKLAIEAREHLLGMAERAGVSFDIERRGILHFYRDAASFNHAVDVSQMLAEGGLKRRSVSNAEIHSIEPTLTGDFYGGFYTESDFSGDIHRYSRGLLDAAVAAGLQTRFDSRIENLRPNGKGVLVEYSNGRGDRQAEAFDAVVVCAGVGSRELAGQLGDRLPIYPVKGYSITVNLDSDVARRAAPRVSLLDDATKIVSSRLGDDRFRIAGTAELNGYNRDIRADRVEPLVNWVRQLFPGVGTDRVIPWAGLRPMMPNMLPRVGAGKHPGVYYNTGHGHLGWTLAGATAVAIADAVKPARQPAMTPLADAGAVAATG
ncbi:MAG: D-amino acid dehydrogenase [Pseudomonadota bacterium]